MSDETLSPDHELANAYLDGHVSAEERARVENSPELLGLVASYQALRVRVADVPPASTAAREAAIAAALAAVPAVLPPSNVVSLERRRWSKALTAAAAVALLGVAGVAVSKLVTGSDADSTRGAAEQIAAADPTGNKQAPTAGGIAGDASLSPISTEMTTSGASSETTVSAGGSGGGGGATDTTAAGSVNSTGAPVISTIDGGASAVPALTDTAELRSLPAPSAPVVPNFAFDCPLQPSQELEAEITWRSRSAVVVRDTVSGVITVLSPECTELVSLQPQP